MMNQIFLLKAGSNESRSSGPEPRIIILKILIRMECWATSLFATTRSEETWWALRWQSLHNSLSTILKIKSGSQTKIKHLLSGKNLSPPSSITFRYILGLKQESSFTSNIFTISNKNPQSLQMFSGSPTV